LELVAHDEDKMTDVTRRRALSMESLGFEAPVETALGRLRRLGFGERVLKSGIAAGGAWLVAIHIHTNPIPVLAPVTAIFTIQPTIAGSIAGSVQRLLGVGAGVAMALSLNRLIGLHWWTISLVVLVSLAAGFRIFKLEQAGVEQMTVSGMLVMIVGSNGNIAGVAGFHILDTVIGTVVGLAANALIAPPNNLPRAQAAVHALGHRLIAVLLDISAGLAAGLDRDEATDILRYAREVAAGLVAVEGALASAEESLRYNIARRRQETAYHRYRRATQALEHAAVQVRVISRTIADGVAATPADRRAQGWLGTDSVDAPLSRLFGEIASYFAYFLAVVGEPAGQSDGQALLAEIAERRRAVYEAAAARFAELMPDKWVLVGEVVSIANQLVTDLSEAANELRRSPALTATASTTRFGRKAPY
jgi:uncharacterized membrane protein YgaE (UPF0421/DUF939 family)